MKATAVFKHTHSFQYWKPIIETDAALNETIRFEYGGARSGLYLPKTNGIATLITTEQMDVDGEIRAMLDRAGNPFFTVDGKDYVCFISSVDAMVDGFGILVGWNHTLKRAME